MSRELVTIKSFPNGINVILDPDAPFNDLYVAYAEKFRDSSKFFGTAKKVFSFEGRVLSDLEERALVEAVSEYSDLTVLCVLKKDEEKDQLYYDAAHSFLADDKDDGNRIYKGCIHSGQKIDSASTVVVLGDVNPGAEINTKGSCIVLGCIYGDVHAGIDGAENAFVAALEIKADTIMIGEQKCSIVPRMGGFLHTRPGARIVYIGKDGIDVSIIDKSFLADIPF